MESPEVSKLLGWICKALSLLIKEHEPTKKAFEITKTQFRKFFDIILEKSGDEMKIIQTGSSFDDLHMCRSVSLYGRDVFFAPATDFDFMMIYTKFMVEDHTGRDTTDVDEESAKHTSDCAFVMVPSSHLGYVKILVTDKGRKLLHDKKSKVVNHIDDEGCLTNDAFKARVLMDSSTEVIYSRVPEIKYTASGPAISNYEHEAEGYTYDFVQAFPCSTWPEVANRWHKRQRDANWPKEELREEIIQDGCAVVPVGFYTSSEQKTEWRLSFNISERKLSIALTENQKICYILVKLLIKTQQSSRAILSSYMVKNMMFWFCEQQYGESEWNDDELGERVLQFMSYICVALDHGNIPHYFLPLNNLIRHKTNEEIKLTADEMKNIRTFPFQALATVCRKLHVFDVEKDAGDVFTAGGSESTVMLTMFISSVQILMRLGVLNHDAPLLAMKCFRNIIALNNAAKPFMRQCSALFSATNVPELLKPFAEQHMQGGQVDEALSLFLMMFNSDKDLVIEEFSNTLSNIACLYCNKTSSAENKSIKTELSGKAEEYFQLALKHISDSPSLHLAYGNYLKDSNVSIRRAILEYKKAIAQDTKRVDDDALIQITLPGKQQKTPNVCYVSGKVVALFSLVEALVDIGEIVEARKVAKQFEIVAMEMELKKRRSALELCAYSYRKLRLTVKASLLVEISAKYG